jgi:hypothetical protein
MFIINLLWFFAEEKKWMRYHLACALFFPIMFLESTKIASRVIVKAYFRGT